MKKLAIGAVAAVIAATSFAGAAEAGWRWKHRHGGWHHHRHHWGVVVRPRVWIGGPRVVIGNGCVVKKKVNRYGEVVRKRYC